MESCDGSIWFMTRANQMLQRANRWLGLLKVSEYSWFFHLFSNTICYSIIILPVFLLYLYFKEINYFVRPKRNTWVSRTLFALFDGFAERPSMSVRRTEEESGMAAKGNGKLFELACCFIGLVVPYILCGQMRETIMTKSYTMPDGSQQQFRDSQFLVFVNQFTICLIALVLLSDTDRPLGAAPLYKYCYCALTNVISTWCQFEAIRCVGFLALVLSKSCKVAPGMPMGKLVSGNRNELHEYITAALIFVGMVLFMIGSADDYALSTVTTMSGVLLLALYVAADGYTSNWQDALFTRYHVTPVQMMCSVNLYSCMLTSASLLLQSGSHASYALLSDPEFLVDFALLTIIWTTSQLFLCHAIARFDTAFFTNIMDVRQALSILASFMVYGHRVSVIGGIGIAAVLAAVPLQIYCRQCLRR